MMGAASIEARIELEAFKRFVRLATSDPEFVREYDRLRGTSLSRHSSPIVAMVDHATGKAQAEQAMFVLDLLDMWRRRWP